MIKVLDKGYVRFVDKMGSDLSVVNAARVSFEKESTELNEKDVKLLRFLADHDHTSPFRHASMAIEIYAPLMVARQMWKYCVGASHVEDATVWNESCFPGNQRIKTFHPRKSGSFITVKELFEKQYNRPSLRSVNEQGEIVQGRVKQVWHAGKADVYRLTTEAGPTVECTLSHRIATPDRGFIHLSELNVGDSVLINGIPAHKNRDWLAQKYVVEGLSQKEIGAICQCTHPSEIVSVEKTQENVDVYDIEMEDIPNLCVGNVVVHNSRRYVTEEPVFMELQADDFRRQSKDKKQGSEGCLESSDAEALAKLLKNHQARSHNLYEYAINLGCPSEQARLFLPAYGMYVRWRWSGSLAMWLHMLDQRLHKDAQYENQQYARAIAELIKEHFPQSMQAWCSDGGN